MFGPPGHAYVYLVYGMYDCLNIVTEPVDHPAAVLVRAVEPLEGLELMRESRSALHATRRKTAARAALGSLPDHRLASGPGLVAAAFGIDVTWTGTDLCDAASPLRLEQPPGSETPPVVRATPRIGIAYAGEPWTEHAWRFVIEGHASASGPASLR
jgi:DNA-3-methyladenine glycosylase